MSRESSELYAFGDFLLNVAEHKLERSDGVSNSSLPEKSFQTLVHLVRNSGRLVTKDELLSSVWPNTVVEENNLGKAIHSIRQYLGDSSAHPKYVETVPKHGYRFVAEVIRKGKNGGLPPPVFTASGAHAIVSLDDWRLQAIPEPEPKPVNPPSPPVVLALRNPKILIPSILVIVAFGLFFGWIIWRKNQTNGANDTTESASASIIDAQRTAYDLYVRGKVKVANENREDTLAAINLLEEAVFLNPDLAEAHAQLARAHNTMSFKFTSGAERKQHHENAEVAIEKALKLNPELAEAHFARGLILWTNTNRFPHEQAIIAYKRSLALEPNSDETHHQLSLIYSHIGLEDKAVQSVRKALELNPNNTLARFRVGVYLQYQGKFKEAAEVFNTIPRDHTPLLVDRSVSETLIQLKRFAEAEAIADNYLRRFPQDEGGSMTSVKALLLAKAGKSADAEGLALRANEIGNGYGHFHHTAYNIAGVYVEIGKYDEAVSWLEKTVDTGFPNYPYFALDPNLERIRNNERFVAFMSQLKVRWERFKDL